MDGRNCCATMLRRLELPVTGRFEANFSRRVSVHSSAASRPQPIGARWALCWAHRKARRTEVARCVRFTLGPQWGGRSIDDDQADASAPSFRCVLIMYARARNNRAGARGRARREVALNAGRRVCARGNGSHPRGQTRSAFRQAGDRDWVVKSAPGRSEAAAAEKGGGIEQSTTAGKTRFEKRKGRYKTHTIADAVTRGEESVEARAEKRGFASSAISSGALGGPPAHQG